MMTSSSDKLHTSMHMYVTQFFASMTEFPGADKEPGIRSGFSLFELLVVILIMSLSLGLFLGFNFRQQEKTQIEAQGHGLVQLMRAAKSTAIVQGEPNTLLFDPRENTVRTSLDQRKERLATNVQLRIYDTELDKEVELAVFYPDGSAWAEDIGLYSTDSAYSVSIQVDPLFGGIRLGQE